MRSCSGRWNWKENTAGNQRGSNSVGHARLHDDDDGDDDRMVMMVMVMKMKMMMMTMKHSGKSETKSERIKPRWTRPFALSFYTFSLSPDFYVFSLPLRSRGICKRRPP